MVEAFVLTGPERRRRWSGEEKATILDALSKPGMTVAEIARCYSISRSLLYRWRSECGAFGSAPKASMSFAPVVIAAPPMESQASLPSCPPHINIASGGIEVRLPTNIAPSMVALIIRTLRSRG